MPGHSGTAAIWTDDQVSITWETRCSLYCAHSCSACCLFEASAVLTCLSSCWQAGLPRQELRLIQNARLPAELPRGNTQQFLIATRSKD
eukprot:scaffold99542_cov16-Tisochrysis_lutea.AAC.1